MDTRRGEPLPFPLAVDHRSPQPLRQQLYEALRRAVLDGQLPAGTRLPSTRVLARDLGIARMTVVQAFAQLAAEGYLAGRVGAGSYVAHRYDNDRPRQAESPTSGAPSSTSPALAGRGHALLAAQGLSTPPPAGAPRAFRPSIPAIDAFPFDLWARLTAHCYRRLPASALNYGEPAGYAPLREAISDYLRAARGVCCAPEQVMVTAGSQQALDSNEPTYLPSSFGTLVIILRGARR